jgi:hypothetical protein
VRITLPDDIKSEKPIDQLDFPLLLAIQKDLETYFTILEINYKIQLTSINEVPAETIKSKINDLKILLETVLQKTTEVSTINFFSSYMEFGNTLKQSITHLDSLLKLLFSNISDFYLQSHYLVPLFWGVQFMIARYELEQLPDYCENHLLFFNFPDELFEFIEYLKEGPQPVEILAQMNLHLRVDKRLPLLLSRTPDHIALSPLGEKLLNAHTITNTFYYYVYDFKEAIMDQPKSS